MSINKAILLGNCGKDPEVKVFDGGAKKASFTLATSKKFKDRDGNLQEKTEWHNIICWRQNADIAEKYIKKGTQLYIEGEITSRSWEDQNGQKKFITEIEAAIVQLLGRKDEGQGHAQAQGQEQPVYQAPMQAPTAPTAEAEGSDDLPF